MIDRYLLRYFLAVIDSGTFTAAAAQVNVSQPTLSAGIAKLERETGAKLFRRNSQRVELTEAGARFAVHARRIEREFNLAQASIGGLTAAGTLRLGVLSTLATADLAAFTARAAQTAPQLAIELVEGNAAALSQHLARGRIDLALTATHGEPGPEVKALRSEAYVLALPASHPLAGEAAVPGEALAGETMIVRRNCEALSETSRYFTRRGIRPFFALRTTNDDRALAMVAAGLGVTVIPASHRHDGVASPALLGFGLSRTLMLAWGDDTAAMQEAAAPIVTALRAQFGADSRGAHVM
ncbi:LysR family transcriptional regulator [Sphingomonas sp. BT-65]|uniref:LysR family transcriptional regulator n=1 Tax=Sphingomonas sp. BT-65 TaxID=2989821 RepID=UPI0022355DF1|nr:LysR family transcriptional regulator [Sphingomonas sp. BT-65]MCW4460211.1 LysR family transcriptional regulator [Sphingomonas sp. BT-65]